MEIYLDANATTPVLPEARAAAIEDMSAEFGNPSSAHGTGLKARAMMDAVRACARRVLRVPTGQLLFLSGATEPGSVTSGARMDTLDANWRSHPIESASNVHEWVGNSVIAVLLATALPRLLTRSEAMGRISAAFSLFWAWLATTPTGCLARSCRPVDATP